MITVADTCSALLIAIDNMNTVCEVGLYNQVCAANMIVLITYACLKT